MARVAVRALLRGGRTGGTLCCATRETYVATRTAAERRLRQQNRTVSSPSLPTTRDRHIVLGIESTCDETGVAVLAADKVASGTQDTWKTTILSEFVASQWHLTHEYRGVHPALAAREHRRNLPRLVDEAISRSGVSAKDVSAVAVAAGPGLAPCLAEGMRFSTQFAAAHRLPMVAVNHLEAHILVVEVEESMQKGDTSFLFSNHAKQTGGRSSLVLLVSGGHTMLVQSKGIGQYSILGSTLDDAVGEAFDKASVMLDVSLHDGESGGAAIERLARSAPPSGVSMSGACSRPFAFPVPLTGRPGCDFSFSGLKSALRRAVRSQEQPLSSSTKALMAQAFQDASVAHLVRRTKAAVDWCNASGPAVQSLIVCGGVAANGEVRKALQNLCSDNRLKLRVPASRYCTDNGVMIAYTGLRKLLLNHAVPSPPASSIGVMTDANESLHDGLLSYGFNPQWPLGPLQNFGTQ